jgi:hypothetical protein
MELRLSVFFVDAVIVIFSQKNTGSCGSLLFLELDVIFDLLGKFPNR